AWLVVVRKSAVVLLLLLVRQWRKNALLLGLHDSRSHHRKYRTSVSCGERLPLNRGTSHMANRMFHTVMLLRPRDAGALLGTHCRQDRGPFFLPNAHRLSICRSGSLLSTAFFLTPSFPL